jgi:hypothetical protein
MPNGTITLIYWGLVIVTACGTTLVAVVRVMRVIREIAMTTIAKSEPKDLPRVLKELAPVIRAIASPLARFTQQLPGRGRISARVGGCRHGQDEGKDDEGASS